MMKYLHAKFILFLTLFITFAFSSLAQTTTEDYYQTATGKSGSELKSALHLIIKGHTELPYTSNEYDVWDALKEADEDPNNSENVILIYTGRSEAKTHQDNGSGDNDSWNREHIWAKSHGDFGTEPGAGTDIHHLRACDRSVNSSRSNLFFDDGGNPHSEANECNFDNDSWEPRDAVKGDIARMIFYMAVRYDGENGEPDLKMTNDMTYSKENYTAPFFGKLSTLLVWNTQDPVSDAERSRNEKVYTIQNNRNPFIDHPEWVDEVWTSEVDTQSPIITELFPSNESNSISLTANCIIKFNENISEGTGNVKIKRYNDDSDFEILTVPSSRLQYSSSQLLINPESQFEEGVKYYILIDNGVIIDASSNSFDGISNKDIWSFTGRFTAPIIVELTPEDNSQSAPVDTDLKITFDKSVQAGEGEILILSDGIIIMEMSSSSAATFDGANVTLDLPQNLEPNTEYNVLIDDDAFLSSNSVYFSGINSNTYWSFTTELPTGIDDIATEKKPSFYPNPANNEICITNIIEIESLYISNLTGRTIMEIKYPNTKISITNLPKGMYFVTFITKNGNKVTKKLLKR